MRLPRRQATAIAAVVMMVGALCGVTNVAPVSAAVGCLNPHCYSIQSYDQPGSQLTGVYISQHNNNMNPGGASAAAPYHITSETWFTLGNGPDSPTNDYIEVGLLDGFEFWSDGSCHCGAYAMFWADTRGDTDTQWQHTIANVSPDGTNHSYQISRGASSNTWYIFMDGRRVGTSTATRSWTGYRMDVGGELYSPSTAQPGSFADTFDIYRQIINAQGVHVNWPRESWTSITSGMNGTDYGHIDHWYWNKPATAAATAAKPSNVLRPAALTPAHIPATSRAAYRLAHYRAAQNIHRPALPRREIVADARRAAAGPGVPPAPPSAAANARLMKLGDFDHANHLTTDPLLSTSRQVWVVTVHAKTPLLTRPGDAARSAGVYTVVYDAVSGAAIEKGVNNDFLK